MPEDACAPFGTLALVGLLHRLEHVGVTRLGKVRAQISEFMDLAPLDDREVPENVDERLANTFASVYHAENRLIDAQSPLEKVLQQSGAYRSVLRRAQPYSQRHLPSIYCDTNNYDDGLSGHLKAVHHQRRELELLKRSRQLFLELFFVWLTRWRLAALLLVPRDFNLTAGLSRLDSYPRVETPTKI